MSYGQSIPNSEVKIIHPSINVEQMDLHSDKDSQISQAVLSKKPVIGIKLNPLDTSMRSRKDYQQISNEGSPIKSNNRSQQTQNNSSPNPNPNRFKSKVPKGYELANYQKAEKYLHTQTYKKKVVDPQTGDIDYESLQVCGGSNQQLKQYGLGIYLYFEFIKRLAVTLFIISIVLIFPMLKSYAGSGLSKYTQSGSFSMTLAKFSLGNIQNGNRQTYLIISIADALSVLIMIIFYLHWRSFHKSIIDQVERDNNLLNPISYVVSVNQFFDEHTNTKTLQKELKTYIDAIYRGSYEVEIVFNYNGYFDKFVQYQQQIQVVQKEHQIMKQTKIETSKLVQEQNKLRQMESELQKISQSFQPKYAIIHFRTLKAKLNFINHCKKFKLVNSLGQKIARSICCTPNPPQKFLFLQKFPISIRSNKLSRPEQINWRNVDLTNVSVAVRYILSLLLVIIVIIITSALISLSTLYAASISSCQSYISPSISSYPTVAQQITYARTQNQAYKFCYCNENFQSIYTDSNLNAFCKDVQQKILITNGLQIGSSLVSAISNVILCTFVSLIAKKVLRPSTKPKQYIFIFWCVLLSNYLNTAILPLVINANIYGTQIVSYIKFLNFMDFNNLSIFSDFTKDWYGILSPYYVTFIIIASLISPIIGLIFMACKNCLKHWKVMRMCSNSDKQNPIIQKQANAAIVQIEFDYPVQSAQVILILYIVFLYSGLVPLLIPIFTLGLMLMYVCKRAMIVKYSVKIPADQGLNESIINFLPYILLFHGLFSIWGHTTPGIFAANSQIYSLSMTIFNSQFDRIFKDVIILAEPVIMVLIILLDYTIFNFLGCLVECCKDQLEMPVQYAAVQNAQFSQRLQKSNILGSYKLINNPTYGLAMKAYNQLVFRANKNRQDSQLNISHNI